MTFQELGLDQKLLRAVEQEGYTDPTPIQQQAIPTLLEGRDLVGCAQTGTGKTAAFSLPMLQRLFTTEPKGGKHAIRALIVAPTRELAIQINDSIDAYGRHTQLRSAVIFGGVSAGKQIEQLRRGVDILVATPGRLLDLHGQGELHLDTVEILVLDEADRMLDMGFIHDIRRIIALLPTKRQTLLFSATMPPEVREIADQYLHRPHEITVELPKEKRLPIEEKLYYVEKPDKPALLAHLIHKHEVRKGIVFTRTKYGADKLARLLRRASITAGAIHGNKSQNARQKALEDFRGGRIHILVASDIAARGIDVDDITHVFNFEIPEVAETYVHRIGRTARAGAAGVAISFCDQAERKYMSSIQKLTRKDIRVEQADDDIAPIPAPAADGQRNRQPREERAEQPRQAQQPERSEENAPQKKKRRSRGRGRGKAAAEQQPQSQNQVREENLSEQPENNGEQRTGKKRRKRGGRGRSKNKGQEQQPQAQAQSQENRRQEQPRSQEGSRRGGKNASTGNDKSRSRNNNRRRKGKSQREENRQPETPQRDLRGSGLDRRSSERRKPETENKNDKPEKKSWLSRWLKW